jgi:two-component sensor histidine kinase/integral membrane sensor domain MASE1
MTPIQLAASIALLAVCYFTTAQFGLALHPSTSHIAAIWPPSGLALAALLLRGVRIWPGVLLGSQVTSFMYGIPPLAGACIAVASVLAAVAGVQLLRLLRFDLAIERSRDVIGLVGVAVITSLLIPTVGASALALYGRFSWSAVPLVWWEWWAADCLGILLVTPLLLTWAHKPRVSWIGWRLIGFIAFIATVLLVSKFAFANPTSRVEPRYLLLSTAFPLLIWPALQFGQRETVLGAVIMSAAAAWAWIHGRAPYPEGVMDRPLLVVDIFIAELMGTALLLGSITARRRRAYDEMEQRVDERTAELASRNEEKEVLLKEIHHRVKNNLQVICSLLNLQARRFDDPRITQAFADSQSRVKSMALVHENLYRSQKIDCIAMDSYVRSLVEGVARTHLQGDCVRYEVTASNITLPIDTAVPCGLIINEMVTNAFKHAFPEGKGGRLSISISERAADRVELLVSDNGVGLPADQQAMSGGSFGMSLVSMLVEQLNATLEVLPMPGTTFRLIFSRIISA